MEIIEDDELRGLFQAETDEHTEKMEQGLLLLEKDLENPSILEDILREAHSLKGSARMLGVTNVESLAHRFEDFIKEATQHGMKLNSEKIDILEGVVDNLRKMADEAVSGNSSGISLANALAMLEPGKAKTRSKRSSPKVPETESTDTPATQPSASSVVQSEQPASYSTTTEPSTTKTNLPSSHEEGQAPVTQKRRLEDREDYQINTIRVDPKKLDVLMTLVGELTVEKTHIEHHLSQTESALALWKDVNQSFAKEKSSELDESASSILEKLGDTLNQLRVSIYEDYSSINRITEGLEDGIRALRLVPLSAVFNLFNRTVRDLSRELSKDVNLVIEGGTTTADKYLIEMIKDPLMHLIRNAIYHGIESADEREKNGKSSTSVVLLRGRRTTSHIVIEVEDDGAGLNTEKIKSTALHRKLVQPEALAAMSEKQIHAFIFHAGFSTNDIVTDISGRGVGLNVVKTNVEQLKGFIDIDSTPGKGCLFSIHLPITLATTQVFLVLVNGIKYALPVDHVRMVRYISSGDIFLVEDRETIALNGDAVSVAWLEDLLEYSGKITTNRGAENLDGQSTKDYPCLFLSKNDQQLGLFVDDLLDEIEVILKPASTLLKRVRNVAGVTILGSGEICVVLNPFDLMKTVQNRKRSSISSSPKKGDKGDNGKSKKPLILLAEDSITTRTQEKRILEGAGYDVVTAVDGQVAFSLLPTRPFDALISDVEMPNMDGLKLTENIRKDEAYRDFPIILVTTLSTQEDIQRGMDVGADAYITKANFNQEILLDTLRRLI